MPTFFRRKRGRKLLDIFCFCVGGKKGEKGVDIRVGTGKTGKGRLLRGREEGGEKEKEKRKKRKSSSAFGGRRGEKGKSLLLNLKPIRNSLTQERGGEGGERKKI